ncbi:hypothetical protein GCM10025794_37280 [Massilia kyonggiensis]
MEMILGLTRRTVDNREKDNRQQTDTERESSEDETCMMMIKCSYVCMSPYDTHKHTAAS